MNRVRDLEESSDFNLLDFEYKAIKLLQATDLLLKDSNQINQSLVELKKDAQKIKNFCLTWIIIFLAVDGFLSFIVLSKLATLAIFIPPGIFHIIFMPLFIKNYFQNVFLHKKVEGTLKKINNLKKDFDKFISSSKYVFVSSKLKKLRELMEFHLSSKIKNYEEIYKDKQKVSFSNLAPNRQSRALELESTKKEIQTLYAPSQFSKNYPSLKTKQNKNAYKIKNLSYA